MTAGWNATSASRIAGRPAPAVVNPFSTGITYALNERAAADHIPLLTMGYGRTDASDGRVFPYGFTLPATYWSQATVLIQYVGAELGGMDRLAGRKIGLLYHDSAYGKEPIPTLQKLAETYGYELHLFPVAHPGLEQKSTWLQIGRQLKPDYVFVWGWGVMTATAIKEAAAVGYPMDHFIGVWWSGAEPDVEPAGAAAAGYMSGAFHAPGTDFPVFDDIFEHVYEKGLGAGEREDVGEVLYNRGIVNAAIVVEAIRTAQEEFGQRPITGEEMRWGLENLDITEERLA
jgi:branched-chain amino acid transport system substrate-binding protein